MRPRLLDLCCGAGGASEGYLRAGFDVYGIDIEAQPNYRFEFVQADALEYLRAFGESLVPYRFDVEHLKASAVSPAEAAV